MNLHPQGREYAEFDILHMDPPDPAAEFEISTDGGATWNSNVTRDGDTLRILLAGPAADDNPPETIVINGAASILARLVDNPEVVIRDVGRVYVTG